MGDAIHPPHPGRFVQQNVIPDRVFQGAQEEPEEIPENLGRRMVADPLFRKREHEWPQILNGSA
eukprot:929908-Amphidinium_carterae.1